MGTEGELRYQSRPYGPKAMREYVLLDLHQSRLTVHSGGGKMYDNLSHTYWWPSVKKDIA